MKNEVEGDKGRETRQPDDACGGRRRFETERGTMRQKEVK